MATIRDVARQAGVSPATVSYVINQRLDQVSNETRQRVLRTMKELDYWPSPQARNLRSKRTGTIAFLVRQSIHPVQAFITSAALAELFRHDFVPLVRDVAIHSTNAKELLRIQEVMVRDCISRRVDGVVDLLGLTEQQMALFREKKVPVVSIDRLTSPANGDSVIVDSCLGGQLAAEHLLQAGYRHMVCFHDNQPERVAGFLDGLKLGGIEKGNVPVIEDVSHPTVAYDRLMALLATGTSIDSVFVTADREALGVYRAIEDSGLRIPDEIGVIGFDDTFSVFMSPALTSVAQPLAEMGYRATALIIERLKSHNRPVTHITLAPQLTIRQSTRVAFQSRRELIKSVWQNDF